MAAKAPHICTERNTSQREAPMEAMVAAGDISLSAVIKIYGPYSVLSLRGILRPVMGSTGVKTGVPGPMVKMSIWRYLWVQFFGMLKPMKSFLR
jgi:hypothetical protein